MVAYVDEFGGRFRAGIGRGRVTDVMREPGVRGVRRGGTPVTARPARGAGGGPGLVERGFEAGAPNRLHRSSGCRTLERTEPGITRTKRRKPPHYKSGTKKQTISMCQTARSHHPSFGYTARRSALAGVQPLVDRVGEHAVHGRTHDLQRRRQAGVLLGELRIQHHELAH